MTKNNPQLRFKKDDGTDYPDWRVVALSDLLDYEQPTKYIVEEENYNDKFSTPVLTANKAFVLGYTNETQGIYSNTPVIIFDDFTTDNKYVDFPFKVKSSAIKILKPLNNSNLKYIYEYMQTIVFHVGAHKRYWISEYSQLQITLPHTDEQKKIADCLSALDELIDVETEQLTHYKEYKLGLLQKLFPKSGQKVPELRFPGFSGEWEEKTLGEVCKITGGVGFPIKYQGMKELSIPFIKVSDMNLPENNIYITIANNYIDKSTAKELRANIFPVNAIVMAKVGAAIFLERKRIVKTPCCIDNNMVGLIPKDSINPIYFYQLLTEIKFSKLSQGNALPALNSEVISSVRFPLPSLEEQQKIADCLSALDELILSQQKRLDHHKEYKLGLMQMLFPKGGR